MEKLSDDEQRQVLNLETGQLQWQDLQRHFAKGAVIKVSCKLDLVEVALNFIRDDKKTIETWLSSKSLSLASDEDAKHWQNEQSVFWAIVIAPWILVQEITKP